MKLGEVFLDVLAKIGSIIPSVERPRTRPSLQYRLFITLAIAGIYLLMANTPLYGIPPQTYRATAGYQIWNIVTAAHIGTLMHVGIGPIIVAGIFLQVLVGSKLIEIDLTDEEQRKKFTLAQRGLALVFIIFYCFTQLRHFYPTLTGLNFVLVYLELVIATLFVMLLDEIITNGWGIGSGISLFILLGIADRIVWQLLSPVTVGEPVGIVWYIPYALAKGDIGSIFIRPGVYPDLLGLIVTFIVVIVLAYLHTMRVRVPIVYSRARGARLSVPLLFLYVSNIPILFTAIVFGILHTSFVSIRMSVNSTWLDWLAKIEYVNGRPMLVGGLAYYLSSPVGIESVARDPLRLVIHSILFLIACVIFGLLWVEVAQSPRMQAEALVESDMSIPGFRANVDIIEKMLARYVYPLTILGSIIVGIIAIIANVFKCYGTGTGLVLLVGILYQYYILLRRERELEMVEWLSKLVE